MTAVECSRNVGMFAEICQRPMAFQKDIGDPNEEVQTTRDVARRARRLVHLRPLPPHRARKRSGHATPQSLPWVFVESARGYPGR